jgi:hypothetical protein
MENCSDTLLGCGNLCLCPHEIFIKNTIVLKRSTRNSLLRQERCTKRGQGDVPLELPPPMGKRGGYTHSFSKRMKSDRIFTESFFYNPKGYALFIFEDIPFLETLRLIS